MSTKQSEQKARGTSLDIGQLADRAFLHYRWDQQHGGEEPGDKLARGDRQALAVLATLMAMEFDPLVLAALNMTYRMYEDGSGYRGAEAIFWYAGLAFRISSTEPEQLGWEVCGWKSNGERVRQCWCHARRSFLQADTLAMMGAWRERLRQRAGEDPTQANCP